MSRRGLALLGALPLLISCQKIFGDDFHVDESAFGGKGGTKATAGASSGGSATHAGSGGGGRGGAGGAGGTEICRDGQRRCEGAELQACNPRHDGWVKERECATSVLCSAETGCADPACAPGEFHCDQAVLQTCNNERTGWRTLDTCPSSAHCDVSGECTKAPCTVGEYRCNGAALERCQDETSGWVSDGPACATAALCKADKHACQEPECDVGYHECSQDGTLRICNADRTGLAAEKKCAAICDDTNGQCDACKPGVFSCDGAELHQCDAEGQTNPLKDTCDSAALCDKDAGRCLVCVPDQYYCSSEGDLQQCSPDGLELMPNDSCGSEALCDADSGKCLPDGAAGAPP